MDGKSVKEKLRSLGVNLAELATKLGYDNDQRLHSQLKAADVKSGLLEDVARAIGCDVSLFYGGSSIPGSNDASAGGGTAVAGVDNRFLARFRSYASLCRSPRTRDIYLVTVKKVLAFDSHAESLSFERITKDWLSRFEVWLGTEQGGCPSVNARSIHLRNVRAVFNDAIDNGITSWYPFRSFKVKSEATKERAVSVEALRSLFSFPGLTWQQQYVDAFKLSFCLVGINLVDLLALKDGQLVDGRLSYRRSKTGRLYDIKVEQEAAALIEKYHGSCGRLVSWGENRKCYTSFTMQMCRGLKAVGSVVKEWRTDDLGVYREVEVFRPAFPMLSSYVARHSWATIAASLDIPKDVIAHALGHGGSSVTDIYIDFDQRKVDEANRRVLDWVFYGTK